MSDEDHDPGAEAARHSARYRRMLSSFLSYALDVKEIPAHTVVSGTLQGIADFIIGGMNKENSDEALRRLAGLFHEMLMISRDENPPEE
jgi:hypothetical protein